LEDKAQRKVKGMNTPIDRQPTPVLYRVEIAAQLAGIPATRVRRYAKIGLVPARSEEGGKPLFGLDEIARLRKIRRLSNDLGLNLAAIEIVLRLLDEIEHLRSAGRTVSLSTAGEGDGELELGR
jgi:MerR family transcriptional regulator/heat shock protein HspR